MKTFDEWFVGKHGSSFDDLHMQPHAAIHIAMKALTAAVREYVTEAVASSEPCLHTWLRNDPDNIAVCQKCGARFDLRSGA